MNQDPGAVGPPGGHGSSPEPCDSAATERVRALEQALEEREQLVTALTVQLEETCERLDRMYRTGSDRAIAVGGGGVPREFVEEQRSVLDELQEAVRRWEEMQAAAALGRIETQVAELRDLLVGGLRGGAQPSDGESDDFPEEAAEETGRGWESMKSALLSDEEGEEQPTVGETEPTDEPGAWIDPPAAIDLSGAPESLRRAVEERDEYIVWLIRRLRWAESPQRLVAGSEGEASDDLARRLAELEHMFDEKLRLAEIELSLERARLAREDARLRQLDDQMQKSVRQAGVQAGPARPIEEQGEPESAKNRRWRRMLGIGEGQ